MSDFIKFSIDKLKIIEAARKSQFAKARVEFFASGDNAHNMPVKEETLKKYADTILGKPLIYVIEKTWFKKEDFGSHDPLEIPMGYFSENEPIEFRKDKEGRLIASAVALIWKKYAEKAMEIFNRDGGKKPVSVEMQVFTVEDTEEGKKEIVDFAFTGCTILGTEVSPAIKDANIEILEFSNAKDEYQKKMKRYSSIDFSIPKNIKDNINFVLGIAKTASKPLLPYAVTKAEYIINNDYISPEDMQDFAKFFSVHKDDDSFFLCGGEQSKSWVEKISEEIRKADEIHFSKTETKEDDKMADVEEVVKSNEEEFATDANLEVAAALVRSEEETAEDAETVEEAKEEMAEEPSEETVEPDEEETEETEEEDFEAEKTEENEEFSAIKKELEELKEKNFALLSELEELRAFKTSVEETNKKAKIEFALSEVSDVMPKEKLEEWREKATTAEFSSVDVWANAVKADAFTYVKQTVNKDNITRMALPNAEIKQTVKKSIWAD